MFHVDIFRLNAIFSNTSYLSTLILLLTLTFHGRQFYLPTVACWPISHLLTPIKEQFPLTFPLEVLCRGVQDRMFLLSSCIQDICWIVEKIQLDSGYF
jgi:hypothetical protein